MEPTVLKRAACSLYYNVDYTKIKDDVSMIRCLFGVQAGNS